MDREAISLLRKRTGWWLRQARERKGLRLNDAASALGMSDNSGPVISLWEAGARSIPQEKLHALARLYDVPLQVFTEPEPTAYERLDEMVDPSVGAAFYPNLGQMVVDQYNQQLRSIFNSLTVMAAGLPEQVAASLADDVQRGLDAVTRVTPTPDQPEPPEQAPEPPEPSQRPPGHAAT